MQSSRFFSKARNEEVVVSIGDKLRGTLEIVLRNEACDESLLQRVLSRMCDLFSTHVPYNRVQYRERKDRKSGMRGSETNRVGDRKCIWPASHAAGLSLGKRHENTGFSAQR